MSGLRLRPGDHVCTFYRGSSQRDQILLPFLRDGLQAGDKCIWLTDSGAETLLSALSGDLDLSGFLARGQLDVRRSTETYLDGGGFSKVGMMDFWDSTMSGAISGGFSFIRAAGEMTWALRKMPGVEELVSYESQLNRFLPRYPQVILCQYDLDQFSAEILVDVLKTHPMVLVGGMILDNPYYLEPDEFLASRY